MTDTANLEKVLQTTVERLVEARLEGFRRELAGAIQEQIAAALESAYRDETIASQNERPASPALETLDEWVARILHPTGQTEVIAATLQGTAAFAGRCALFVRRGDAFTFWRAEGFGPESVGNLRSLSLSATSPGIFKDCCDMRQIISSPFSQEVLSPTFARALGDGSGSAFYLVPIAVQGRVVAALYADAGTRSGGSVEPAGLDIIARVCGLSLETASGRAARAGAGFQPPLTARDKMAVSEPAPSAEADSASSAPQPEATISAALNPPPEGPLEKEVPEDNSLSSSALVESSKSNFAGYALASPPTEPMAPVSLLPGSFAASIPHAPDTISTLAPPPDPDALPEADRDCHRKAHRFARVAVQDLLSYHKSKVELGRKEKNLYSLLSDDIDKIRANYQQRFDQTAARSYDYLYYEMVSKLAGNDPEALGVEYPAPSEVK